MEKEYTLLGEAWQENAEPASGNGTIAKLERYCYFDGEKILSSLKLPEDSRRLGEKLYRQGMIQDVDMSTGYEPYRRNSEMLGHVRWKVDTGRTQFETSVSFSRSSVESAECGCKKCLKKRGRYGWYYTENSDCEYVAALLLALRDFLKTHNVGDATDRNASFLMASNRQKRANLLVADKTAREESITLKPRLVKKDAKLTISFKIGTGRLFVIKQLDEFCTNVHKAATATYGSGTEINHRRSNFTDESQKWLRFIERIVQEESEFGQRLEDATRSRYYYTKSASVGSTLNLFGWRLDEFYNEVGDGTVEYEDRDAEKTKKMQLHCGEGNPRITMQISEAEIEAVPIQPEAKAQRGKKSQKKEASLPDESAAEEFHGIQVDGRLPELYLGMNCAYYVNGDVLCRSEPGFQEKIEDLTALTDENEEFSFRVGRNNLSEFYYQVLPALQDVVEVVETDPERIHSYLPSQVTLVFYLDARENDVICSPFARYEETELSLLDSLDEEREADME
ncbi:MAG: SNF2 helicase associated domain-containing protein, partial [Lachnospiraceae bacterium]|nr:SNF2 helicase associated domain-containing protein [Lachnospiraceae bacterium]